MRKHLVPILYRLVSALEAEDEERVDEATDELEAFLTATTEDNNEEASDSTENATQDRMAGRHQGRMHSSDQRPTVQRRGERPTKLSDRGQSRRSNPR